MPPPHNNPKGGIMKDDLFDALGVVTGCILGAGYLFSVPVGVYLGFVRGELFHLLASIFVPFYGLIYGLLVWIF